MKKIIYITIILIITISLLTIIFIKKEDKIIKNNSLKNYPFYKEELLKRYQDYQEINHTNDKDTIIKVNIGLDKPFYTNTKRIKNQDSYTVLVNKYNYLDKDYIPKDLVVTTKYSKGNIKLRKIVYDHFLEMANDAKLEDLNLRIISSYRSYDYQKDLYHKYLKQDSREIVDTYSARAGFSEHQTGLSIDIDNIYTDYNKFDITLEYKWMMDNAYKYGFILRYPKGKEDITGFQYESWHYRYVGCEIAKYIHHHNITFDEYYYEFLDK